MSAVQKLEALINIKEELKAQYEDKLQKLEVSIKTYEEKQKTLQATIDQQLEKISELISAGNATKQLEQANRELSNRAEKSQGELNNQKAKAKSVQKELAEAKAEIKQLKQLDAEKLKKNLVATKKKLAEKTSANDLLNKSLNKTKSENIDLQRTITELKEELEALKPEAKQTDESVESVESAA